MKPSVPEPILHSLHSTDGALVRRSGTAQAGDWLASAPVLTALAVLLGSIGFPAQRAAGALVEFNVGVPPVNSYSITEPGGTVTLPITVSSSLSGSVVNWLNCGLVLQWDASLLSLQTPVSVTGSALPLSATGNFTTTVPGQLTLTWVDLTPEGTGVAVANGSTLFTLTFLAVDFGRSTDLTFNNLTTIGLTDSTGFPFETTSPLGNNGSITVVPEPVNCALALFGCVLGGTTGFRWLKRRKSSTGCPLSQ